MNASHRRRPAAWLTRSACRALVVLLGFALLAGCGRTRRPPFSIETAKMEIASAFEKKPADVAIYDDYEDPSGGDEIAWIVDFKLEDFEPFMQARFRGEPDRWALDGARERSTRSDAPWRDVGLLVGQVRGELTQGAEQTVDLIEDLAHLVERYAVDHGNSYPTVDIHGLKGLLMSGDYTKRWWFDNDGFGNSLIYHASPDGQAYIILSPGADGEWEISPSEYFANTDRGMEAYDGIVTDPDRDLIYATGYFAQRYQPPR